MSPTYSIDQRLTEADPTTLGQRVPKPLHERVEELCDLLYGAKYARPSKAKLLAALVFDAPTDVKALNRIVRRYERASVGDALVSDRRVKEGRVKLPVRKSGPRSARSS
jgi:hypothetical protein